MTVIIMMIDMRARVGFVACIAVGVHMRALMHAMMMIGSRKALRTVKRHENQTETIKRRDEHAE